MYILEIDVGKATLHLDVAVEDSVVGISVNTQPFGIGNIWRTDTTPGTTGFVALTIMPKSVITGEMSFSHIIRYSVIKDSIAGIRMDDRLHICYMIMSIIRITKP